MLTGEAVDGLRRLIASSNAMKTPPAFYSGELSKIGYDIEAEITQEIYSAKNFQHILKQLTDNRGAAFIQGIGFELESGQQGFNWHHDILSFCSVMPEDPAYTIWTPLDPINTKAQHGGMSYVSRKIYSARNYFDLVYQLVQQANIPEFSKTKDFKNWGISYASPVEQFLLDNNKVEDDFEVGDALLLDKYIWHKSCPLDHGVLTSRKAYVMRFLDCRARYSKILADGTCSLFKVASEDCHSNLTCQLANSLNDGEMIADKLEYFKRR